MTSRRLVLCSALILSFLASAAGVRAEEDPMMNEEVKPAPKASKKKPAKKKGYDYERSKYKSKAPENVSTYRFDAKGEPVTAETKKKASAKKKKRSEPPEAGLIDGSGVCGAEEACTEKKTEADAL